MTGSRYIPADMRPYFDLIDDALNATPRDYSTDPEHDIPAYIRRMCERLLVRIRADRADATLKEVLVAECQASGHTDYHRRLARACVEIAGNSFGVSFAKR